MVLTILRPITNITKMRTNRRRDNAGMGIDSGLWHHRADIQLLPAAGNVEIEPQGSQRRPGRATY